MSVTVGRLTQSWARRAGATLAFGLYLGLTGSTLAGASAPAANGCRDSIAYVTHGESVWVARPGGAHRRRIASGTWPTLSPDGRLVAILRPTSTLYDASLYSTCGGPPKLSFASAVAAVWSPDSRYLAVATVGADGVNERLQVVDVHRGTVRTVARGYLGGLSFAPATPDRLVFANSTSARPRPDLYEVDVADHGAHRLTFDGHSLNPTWGAAGIVFVRETTTTPVVYELFLLRGGRTAQISSRVVGGGLNPVALSADGTRLLAESAAFGTATPVTVDLMTGRMHTFPGAFAPFGIDPAGTRVLLASGAYTDPLASASIETVPFSGGSASVLVRNASDPSHVGGIAGPSRATIIQRSPSRVDRAAWLKGFAHYLELPLRDFASAASGLDAYVPATDASWAMVHYEPAAHDNLKTKVRFQDGGGTAIVTRSGAGAWRVVGAAGEPAACAGWVPAPVMLSWGLSCSG